MKNNTLKGRTILMVHTGSIPQRFIYPVIKKLGVNIVCLNREKNWANPYIQHWILADLNDFNQSIEAVEKFIIENPDVIIEGALTYWEESTLLTSKICDHFGFVGIPYHITEIARNKYLFREFSNANDIPAPRNIIVKSEEDLPELKSLYFPIVLKPVYGSESAYVVKVDSFEDVNQTYKYIIENLASHPDAKEWPNLNVIAEEFIDGHEVDIDIILQNGKMKFYAISDNYQTNEPFFVEVGDAIPSSLTQKEQKALIEMAEESLEKLGIQNGIIHYEAKSSSRGPMPIEINLRMGGDNKFMFIKEAWNVNLIENNLKIAFGIYIPKIKTAETPEKYLCQAYFLADYSGVLVKMDVNENIRKNKNLSELYLFKEVGDIVLSPPEGYEYIGWVTAKGNNMIDAEDNLKKFVKEIKYEISKFDEHSSLGRTIRKKSMSLAALNKDLLFKYSRIQKLRHMSLKKQRHLNIGVAGNYYGEKMTADGFSTSGKAIEKALIDQGYKAKYFDFNNFNKAFSDLKNSNIDIIFNTCERINNSITLESHSAAFFDVLKIPYTGSKLSTLLLAGDKISVKKLLSFHNIPTPRWDYVYSIDDEIDSTLNFPLIVKPSNMDDYFGITNESVVTDKKQLKIKIERILSQFIGPVLIEEYIDGDEYDVGILGNEQSNMMVLPLRRSIFKDLPPEVWKIYSSDSKNPNNAVYSKIITQTPPKNISKKLEKLITEIAIDTYSVLDCTDYGHVGIRVDKNGNPFVLELNPNPSINPGDIFPGLAEAMDIGYGDLIEEILGFCLDRCVTNNKRV